MTMSASVYGSLSARVEQPAPDRQVVEMRRLLLAMSARTGSEALEVLRRNFPDTPLSARVAALASFR